jgi:hypothetical protein
MCVEDAKVLAVNFARNISRKRWGGGEEQNPSPPKEEIKQTNKRNFKFPNRLSRKITWACSTHTS